MTMFTQDQLLNAVEVFSSMFPEEAENLNTQKALIVEQIIKQTDPDPDSPLCSVKFSNNITEGVTDFVVLDSPLTPCEEASGSVIADVVFFALGLVGLHTSNQARLTRAILQEMGVDTLNGFSRSIQAFRDANNAKDKAEALFTLLGQIWKAGGFKAAFQELKNEMTWWEWTKTGVIAVAQITAWFASDGLAFIAEAALSVMSATQLIQDSVNAGKACNF